MIIILYREFFFKTSAAVKVDSRRRHHTKVQHLSFEYFTSRGVTLAGAKAANRV